MSSPAAWVPGQDGVWFLLATQGAGVLSIGPVRHPFSAGDLLVLGQRDTVQLASTNGEDLVFQSFSIRLEHLFPLFAGHEIPLVRRVAEGLRRAKHYAATSMVARTCHALVREVPAEKGLEERSQLVRIAAIVLAAELEQSQAGRARFLSIEDRIKETLEGISADELLGLSVKELAAQLGCSRRHLNRLFHRYFGYSVAGLRMELRLLKAVTLLRDPEAKIAIVARECGFNCPNVFNSCFKRRFGSSPGERRKLLLEESTLPPGNLDGRQPDCLLHAAGVCPWIANGSPRKPRATRRTGHNGSGRNRKTPHLDRAGVPKLLITIKAVQPGVELPETKKKNGMMEWWSDGVVGKPRGTRRSGKRKNGAIGSVGGMQNHTEPENIL